MAESSDQRSKVSQLYPPGNLFTASCINVQTTTLLEMPFCLDPEELYTISLSLEDQILHNEGKGTARDTTCLL